MTIAGCATGCRCFQAPFGRLLPLDVGEVGIGVGLGAHARYRRSQYWAAFDRDFPYVDGPLLARCFAVF